MKYFAIILSLFTIILTAIPCDDEVITDANNLTVITSEHSDDSDFHLDLCTPFDTCDCCATPITINDIFVLETTPEAISSELNAFYISSFSKDFIEGIFQPPRV